MPTGKVARPASIATHRFDDDGRIPNNPRLPLLAYSGALLLEGDPAAACEGIFTGNRWDGSWRNGVYDYHHFHSTAHEVLGVVYGNARIRFGGERGITVTVRAGDVVVIPAGVGHKSLGASSDFLVVAAYPNGQNWDLCIGKPEEHQRALENIRRVPLPALDPVYGAGGPLLEHWHGEP